MESWTRFGNPFDWDAKENGWVYWAVVSYMDDDIRESLHLQLAPCTNSDFMTAYINEDPDFEDLLDNEFGIKRK